jgi:hypothetical protein
MCCACGGGESEDDDNGDDDDNDDGSDDGGDDGGDDGTTPESVAFLLSVVSDAKAAASALVAGASNDLNSLATSRSVVTRGLADELTTAETEESNARDAYDETQRIRAEAVDVNPDVVALADLKVEANEQYNAAKAAFNLVKSAKNNGVSDKNDIISAANALATPQSSCADEQASAKNAFESLVNDYPSEQAAAATALADMDATTDSCNILLQYGTTAEIKAEANSDV